MTVTTEPTYPLSLSGVFSRVSSQLSAYEKVRVKIVYFFKSISKLTGNPLSLALLRVETDFRSTVALKASWDGLCLCIRVPLCANSARLRLADTSSNVWKGTAASNSSLAEAMSAEISSLTS